MTSDRDEKANHPHQMTSFLQLFELLSPILKYYAVLMVFYYVARRFNRALDDEVRLENDVKPTKRPNLSMDLMPDDTDDEAAAEEEIHEELVTDGFKLVSMSKSDAAALRERKPTTKNANEATKLKPSKQHPLFEGLQQVEEELRKQKDGGTEDTNVSWNELHASMLKRYQEKYPDHGLRVADANTDEYNDEFKELLKKHKIDPTTLKKQE